MKTPANNGFHQEIGHPKRIAFSRQKVGQDRKGRHLTKHRNYATTDVTEMGTTAKSPPTRMIIAMPIAKQNTPGSRNAV